MAERSLARNLAMESTAPLYKEVEREIMQCLARGEWKPGDRLPSESELAERFGVAVFTIRAGIQKLADSGILLRRQGKGTFVTLHRARPSRNQFLRVFTDDGKQASWDRELVAFSRTRADDETAAILELDAGAGNGAVYKALFLLRTEGEVVAILDSKMNARLFRNATEAAFRDVTDNLYAVFQERFGVNVIRIDERIRAKRAGRAEARSLGLGNSDPVLAIERVAYTYNDVPVEFRRYCLNADRYHYFATRNA
jgi:GntR family transcriptional regulator